VSGDQFLRHLTELFRLLLDFTSLGTAERRMLLMNGDLDKLMDFYMSDHTPYFDARGEKITRASMPSFSLLAGVISQLVRTCRLSPEQGGVESMGPSPYALDRAPVVLPARSFAKLMHKQFIHQMCTEDPAMALDLVKHLMHRNTELSNTLCVAVRAGCIGSTQGRVNAADLRGYFKVLYGMLTMDDSLAAMRAEWILPWLVDRMKRVIERQMDGDTLFLCLTCRLLLSLTLRNPWVRSYMVQQKEEWSTWLDRYKEERRMSQSHFSYGYGYSTTRTSRPALPTSTAGAGWFPSV
jgi:hypothetical protein